MIHIPLTLAAFFHRIDPFAIQISGNIGIRWHGLSYLAGFLCAFLVIRWLTNRGKTQLKPRQISDLIVCLAIGTLAGGRIGYCAFYDPALFISFSNSFPWWGLLAINNGGMASHGGMIGVLLACFYFARKRHISFLHLLDLTALCGTIGICFGRIANFINGELFGRPCSPNLPWAVRFPQEIYEWTSNSDNAIQLTNQLHEYNSILFPPGPSDVLARTPSLITTIQTNDTIAAIVEPLLTPRHPSQIYASMLEGALLFIILLLIWRKARKPGIIAGCFGVLYAVVRIFDEMFRMPDIELGLEWLNLSRGQWLSIIMLSIAVACLLYWQVRPAKSIGGWRNSP